MKTAQELLNKKLEIMERLSNCLRGSRFVQSLKTGIHLTWFEMPEVIIVFKP